MEFNEDGSLKIPEELIKNKEEESKSIVLRRVQVNTNNPAIAQVRIEYPEVVRNTIKILNYYEKISHDKFKSVDSTIKQIDDKTYVVEVGEGSWLMYSFLDYLIEHFEEELKKEGNVIIRGKWDKFD